MPLRVFRSRKESVELEARSQSSQLESTIGTQPAEEAQQLHRVLPILSGLLCPFAVLLEIPALTQRWYVREQFGVVVETRANPAVLNAGIALSLIAAVAANVALVLRFLERKPRAATLIAMLCLLVHDVINIIIVTAVGVIRSVDDGFTYGEPFYMTIVATFVSIVCSFTLLLDYYHTPDFAKNGSGLSEKQRLLVIVVMVLLIYLALGSMAFSFLLELSFISSMYFVIVTISTTGFGDIVPSTVASKIVSFFFDICGIVLVALTIAIGRETVIEGFERSYRRRREALAARVRKRKVERQERFRQRRERRAQHGSIEANTSDQRSNDEHQAPERSDTQQEQFISFKDRLESERKREFRVKLAVSSSLFVFFWVVGGIVFKYTEGWAWLESFFFCYVTFTTIGYGNVVPTSFAGRAFFIVWALFGIAVMTILLSVLTESWSRNFRSAVSSDKPPSPNPPFLPPSPSSALDHLPQQTLDAIRSFDAHARHFISGRQGEIPEELRSLLLETDDAALGEPSGGGELSVTQGNDERRTRGSVGPSQLYYLPTKLTTIRQVFLASYERSLRNVKDALESIESRFETQAEELATIRRLNSDLRRQLESRDVFIDGSRDEEVEDELIDELDGKSEGGNEDDAGDSSFKHPIYPPTAINIAPTSSSPSTFPRKANRVDGEKLTASSNHRQTFSSVEDSPPASTSQLQYQSSLSLPHASPPSALRSSPVDESFSMTTLSSPPDAPDSSTAPSAPSQSTQARSDPSAGLGLPAARSRTSTLSFLAPTPMR